MVSIAFTLVAFGLLPLAFPALSSGARSSPRVMWRSISFISLLYAAHSIASVVSSPFALSVLIIAPTIALMHSMLCSLGVVAYARIELAIFPRCTISLSCIAFRMSFG
jgi:hypothetical protein